MGIKEIMAARKAAAEAANPVPEKVVPSVEAVAVKAPVSVELSPEKEEPKVTGGKPLSFAELLAAKRKAASTSPTASVGIVPPVVTDSTKESTGTPASTPAASPSKAGALDHLAEIVHKQATYESTGLLNGKTRAERTQEIMQGLEAEVTDETAQAFVDIKLRIDELVELSEEPLVQSMTELKKALMKNPSAVSLMLDSDIGQMVIALRKMTHTAVAEASKPKDRKSPKASKVSLTAEALEAAFDDM